MAETVTYVVCSENVYPLEVTYCLHG